MTSTALTRFDPKAIAAIDEVVKAANLQCVQAMGAIQQALVIACAVNQLKEMVTADMMKEVMALQNTALGFKTDKPDSGYPVEIVKACFIEGCIRGVRPVNNEWNIISKNFYIAKNGLVRLVREYAGMSKFKPHLDVPQMKNGGAVVHATATWKLNGVEDGLQRDIPVRVNAGMGSDAILGKAMRKLLASVYGQVTGSDDTVPTGDVEDMDLAPNSSITNVRVGD